MAKVYLDMDGVLADFFGRWEEIICIMIGKIIL